MKSERVKVELADVDFGVILRAWRFELHAKSFKYQKNHQPLRNEEVNKMKMRRVEKLDEWAELLIDEKGRYFVYVNLRPMKNMDFLWGPFKTPGEAENFYFED